MIASIGRVSVRLQLVWHCAHADVSMYMLVYNVTWVMWRDDTGDISKSCQFNKRERDRASWVMRGVLALFLLSATGAYWAVTLSARRVHLLFQSVVSSICNDIVCWQLVSPCLHASHQMVSQGVGKIIFLVAMKKYSNERLCRTRCMHMRSFAACVTHRTWWGYLK